MAKSSLLPQVLFALVALGVGYWYTHHAPHVYNRYGNLEKHPYFTFNPIWDPADAKDMLQYTLKQDFVSTVKADATGRHEHIGEAEPIQSDGSCSNSFLIPNQDKTLCIFPARFDVAHHHVMSGGIEAHRESFKKTVSRLIVFQKFFHSKDEATNIPQVAKLFQSEEYKKRAVQVCDGKPILDPMQLSIILALPGQEVAMHYDAPWFFGADRFDFPVWLLVAMERSSLFEHLRIPQVQGVAYIHREKNVSVEKGGFYFFPNGTTEGYVTVPAQHNTALILNGAEVVHGTETFRPQEGHPPVVKNRLYAMRHTGNDIWELREGDSWESGTTVRTYNTDELRLSFVWRQRCFADEAERQRFRDKKNPLELEDVLKVFVDDLEKRGRLSAGHNLTRFQLGRLITQEYIRYPFNPDVYMPYNLCAIEALAPSLTALTQYFC
eukprot:GFYU01010061.1.p1 GENE.GFYU01010061.1~~GFYU01010061.1.p1  ORF type:complete len:448 (-),score=113.95 GFYU01010061.1:78-1388(-)